LFDRPQTGQRAILVHLTLHAGQEDLLELNELAQSAGAEPVHTLTGSRRVPDARYFIGTGIVRPTKI
jgi:GTP-binding protein HflX